MGRKDILLIRNRSYRGLRMSNLVQEEFKEYEDKILEIKDMQVIIEPLKSGSLDVILLNEFDSIETLEAYQVHSEHLKISYFVG